MGLFPDTGKAIARHHDAVMSAMVPTAVAGLALGQGLANAGAWGIYGAYRGTRKVYSNAENGFLFGAGLCLLALVWAFVDHFWHHTSMRWQWFVMWAAFMEVLGVTTDRIALLATYHPRLANRWVFSTLAILGCIAVWFSFIYFSGLTDVNQRALTSGIPRLVALQGALLSHAILKGTLIGWAILEAVFWLGAILSTQTFLAQAQASAEAAGNPWPKADAEAWEGNIFKALFGQSLVKHAQLMLILAVLTAAYAWLAA